MPLLARPGLPVCRTRIRSIRVTAMTCRASAPSSRRCRLRVSLPSGRNAISAPCASTLSPGSVPASTGCRVSVFLTSSMRLPKASRSVAGCCGPLPGLPAGVSSSGTATAASSRRQATCHVMMPSIWFRVFGASRVVAAGRYPTIPITMCCTTSTCAIATLSVAVSTTCGPESRRCCRWRRTQPATSATWASVSAAASVLSVWPGMGASSVRI